jgi:UDP-glucose 4-epimerase
MSRRATTHLLRCCAHTRSDGIIHIYPFNLLAAEILGWRATRSLNEMLADHWRWQQQHPGGYQ